jgi:hypothetical protein
LRDERAKAKAKLAPQTRPARTAVRDVIMLFMLVGCVTKDLV